MKRLMQFDLAAPHFRFPLRWMPRVAAIFIALFASLAALTATAPNPLPHIDILQPVSAAPRQSRPRNNRYRLYCKLGGELGRQATNNRVRQRHTNNRDHL